MSEPLTEIEVEGVGTIRHLNMWQIGAMRKCQGANRYIAPFAFSAGMTVRQFKTLTPELQEAVRQAYHRLTSPANMVPSPEAQAQQQARRLPRPGEHVSKERMIELGRELLEIKARLPRGHFGPWVEEKSGITYSQAQRFMRAAKGKPAGAGLND
ncbi:DUF3102 domain-containing protein [Sinorhizobium fredii]|uniref:DUF3102 domain-containing protein n=1 Tax=Rhizobium fredii TaxID=380 RepID=UPI0004BCD3DC|nr:DUF3102 domain-containing protein [Sinorhizobium fredii]AWI58631.1 hypothetical protein AB395_00002987 [Sinorhizobium fredii CCBAU 45436]